MKGEAEKTKIVIELEVPYLSIEQLQKFVVEEDERNFGMPTEMKSEEQTAVDIFMTLYISGKLDYTVTKAEMVEEQ